MSGIVTRIFGLDDYGRPVAPASNDPAVTTVVRDYAARRANQPVILFLAANPQNTEALRIPEELQDIKERLRSSTLGRTFDVEFEPAAVFRDLVSYVLEATPTILHFSGHGATQGIALLDERGDAALVSTAALSRLFSSSVITENLQLVVLNSCLSEAQALAIVGHVDCVIGMKSSIPDPTARAFSSGLYSALGFGQDVATAFELATTQVGIESLPGDDIPRLFVRDGVDARTVKPLQPRSRGAAAQTNGVVGNKDTATAPRRANPGAMKVGDRHWRWQGAIAVPPEQAYDAVEQALTRLGAGTINRLGRSRLTVGTGGPLDGRFAPTEEVSVELVGEDGGTGLTVESRSTQFQISDFGKNEANVRQVVALLGLTEH